MIVRTTTIQREAIHWLWLWTLAAIAVSVTQAMALGQTAQPVSTLAQGLAQRFDDADPGNPIPMPNVDQPDSFAYPNESPLPPGEAITLSELLQLHRNGNFAKSLKGWQRIRTLAGSETWRQLGIGVALLRLDMLDQAMEHLENAVELDPSNAVAEYFMGRTRQAQGRQVPSWYESDDRAPFRLASVVEPLGSSANNSIEPQHKPRPKMLLPHYIDDAYDRLARKHFRRAVMLAPTCDLNRVIRVASESPPLIQLASQQNDRIESVTIGDLLDSLGERDYVRKSKTELGMRGTPTLTEDSAAASVIPDSNWIAID